MLVEYKEITNPDKHVKEKNSCNSDFQHSFWKKTNKVTDLQDFLHKMQIFRIVLWANTLHCLCHQQKPKYEMKNFS